VFALFLVPILCQVEDEIKSCVAIEARQCATACAAQLSSDLAESDDETIRKQVGKLLGCYFMATGTYAQTLSSCLQVAGETGKGCVQFDLPTAPEQELSNVNNGAEFVRCMEMCTGPKWVDCTTTCRDPNAKEQECIDNAITPAIQKYTQCLSEPSDQSSTPGTSTAAVEEVTGDDTAATTESEAATTESEAATTESEAATTETDTAATTETDTDATTESEAATTETDTGATTESEAATTESEAATTETDTAATTETDTAATTETSSISINDINRPKFRYASAITENEATTVTVTKGLLLIICLIYPLL